METSQAIGKISEALAKAQGQMKPAAFDAQNPHFKSKYATLASIMEACRPALSANGIAIIQGTSVKEGRVEVTTILTHVSGEWIKDTISIKPARDDAQGIGSAITYARRYSLAALVGIVSDEDDDGESAVGRTQPKATITPIRKVQDTPKAEAPNPEPSKPEVVPAPAITNPEPVASAPAQAQPRPNQINPRIAKIREIFTLSGKLGQTPDQMKEAIGAVLNLGRAIRESSEITDQNIDMVLESFRQALFHKDKAMKEAA